MLLRVLISISTGCPADRAAEVLALMSTQQNVGDLAIKATDKFVSLARAAWQAIQLMDNSVA